MVQPATGAGRPPWRDIGLALLAKAVALALIYFLFFASPPAVPPGPQHLFGAPQHGTRR